MTARRRPRRPVSVPELQTWAREVESTALKEPEKATPYLDPKHICAYDGPVKGCLCEEAG